MTQSEIDMKIYDCQSAIYDKFKDIQAHANSLKTIDRPKNEIAFSKINDIMDDIRRIYEQLDDLMYETADPEPEDTDTSSFL